MSDKVVFEQDVSGGLFHIQCHSHAKFAIILKTGKIILQRNSIGRFTSN